MTPGFDVILMAPGDAELRVIEIVRKATGFGPRYTASLLNELPQAIKEGLDQAKADRLKADLEEAGATVELRSPVDPENVGADVKMLGGFTVVGGNGFGLAVSSVCSVLTVPEVVRITVEIGRPTVVTIPYSEMTALDVAGGAQTAGRQYLGGGFGLLGAVEGMVIASALSNASQKTTINTGMHIGSIKGEVLLYHGALTSSVIRTELSPLWTRYEAAKRSRSVPSPQADDPVQLLARLGELHAAGVLSDEEFQAKKAELLRRI